MTDENVSINSDMGITHLRLERAAKGNSLSRDMVQRIDAAIDTCCNDGTRALLIDGAGANFCTGFDLSGLDDETDDTLLARFVAVELMLQKLYRAPFLTAALIHGKAWGAGADLMAACTMRWARPEATFAFPGAGFGLVLGSGRLSAIVGNAAATEWIASGKTIRTTEGFQCGLVQPEWAKNVTSAQAIEGLRAMAARLDATALAQIRNATQLYRASNDATDLALLVRSASRAGLKARILAYRASLRTIT